MKTKFSLFLMLFGFLLQQTALAVSTEERFKDLFTTAGYATAFGAALGAAALSFKENPENHLKYVAVGASLGFIGGSIMGSYIVFSPVIAAHPESNQLNMIATNMPQNLQITPVYDSTEHKLAQIHAAYTIKLP